MEQWQIEKKKRQLKRYKKNKSCIARLHEKITTLDERLKHVKSPNYSSVARGGTPVTVDELLSDKIELEERVARLEAKGAEIKREIIAEIDSLEDVRHVAVLESFFIDCLSHEEIAQREGYDVRHVYRLYKEGVRILTQNSHEDDILSPQDS